MKVIMAKDSAFIPTLKDGDFSLCPSRSYKLNGGGTSRQEDVVIGLKI